MANRTLVQLPFLSPGVRFLPSRSLSDEGRTARDMAKDTPKFTAEDTKVIGTPLGFVNNNVLQRPGGIYAEG